MRMLAKGALGLALAALLLAGGCATSGPEAGGSEAALERAVLHRLADDDLTRFQSFGVTANGNVITLRGSVPNETTRMRAVGIVLGTHGVGEVVDELYVW